MAMRKPEPRYLRWSVGSGRTPAWPGAGALAIFLSVLMSCTLSAGEERQAEVWPAARSSADTDHMPARAGSKDALNMVEIKVPANPGPATGHATAAASPDRAALFIQQLGQLAIATVADGSLTPEQRRRSLRLLFLEGFDLDAISRLVLGRYWRQATPAQRAEYRRLFQEFIVAIYMDRFGRYSGEILAVTGAYLGKRNIVVVKSLIHFPRPGKAPIEVDWLVRNAELGSRIIDVVIGGVSMAITQRSEFASIIHNNGGQIEGLLAALRARTG